LASSSTTNTKDLSGTTSHSIILGGMPRRCIKRFDKILFYCAIISWDEAPKNGERVAIYNDTLNKFDKIWGGNNLLYHKVNTRKMMKH
jgi:hypothetical protein